MWKIPEQKCSEQIYGTRTTNGLATAVYYSVLVTGVGLETMDYTNTGNYTFAFGFFWVRFMDFSSGAAGPLRPLLPRYARNAVAKGTRVSNDAAAATRLRHEVVHRCG